MVVTLNNSNNREFDIAAQGHFPRDIAVSLTAQLNLPSDSTFLKQYFMNNMGISQRYYHGLAC